MKNVSLTLIGLLIAGILSAQSNKSQPMSFRIEKEVVPPMLKLVEGSLLFEDANGNNFINANEQCFIRMKICNHGKGDAFGCTANMQATGTTDGLRFGQKPLPVIHPNETISVDLPIEATIDTKSGTAQFEISIKEPNGFGIAPMQLNVGTRRFEAPMVEIVSYRISSEGENQLKKMKNFHLQLLLQNTDVGVAKNVTMQLQLPEFMYVIEGERYQQFNVIQPNEQKLIDFEFVTNGNIADEVALAVQLHESWGKYAKNTEIPLHFGQAVGSSKINLDIKGEEKAIAITIGSLVSDVDENIPVVKSKNPNTFVLILANEHYQQVATVPFALNDGNIFREYCIKTLGISDKHIKYLSDATGNQLKAGINWLSNLTEAFDNPQIIVYYAGHGIPDESSRTAYLLPVDGIISDLSTCYKLDDLYTTLGNMPASQITVFMDACFSGSKREQGMLASARGVALAPRKCAPQGNMVVFSAAQGDETAYPDREQQHGLFTYYLLKKLKETSGDIALKDLGDYIIKQVSQQSLLMNDKKQTPCVTPSASVGTKWQNWKLK